MAKRDGSPRILTVPIVRDRVAQAAVLNIIEPLFEAQFETYCDIVVMIVAPLERRVDWLAKDRGWNFVEIFSRIHAQKYLQKNTENLKFMSQKEKGKNF